MKRWVWITASLAALFGLQGSLCAVACLAGPPSEALSHPPVAEMPCHGVAGSQAPGPAPDPASDPAKSGPGPDPSCGCEASIAALTEDGAAIATNLTAGIPSPRVSPVRVSQQLASEVHPNTAERLPPPDILLLNSTLIV